MRIVQYFWYQQSRIDTLQLTTNSFNIIRNISLGSGLIKEQNALSDVNFDFEMIANGKKIENSMIYVIEFYLIWNMVNHFCFVCKYTLAARHVCCVCSMSIYT